MKRAHLMIASCLVLGLFAAGCSEEPERKTLDVNSEIKDKAPIVIGLDEDSTGPGASYSTVAGQTIRDAVEILNSKDGIDGHPVKLVVENDESDPTKAPSVIRKLIDQDADVLLLVTSSAAVNQAKPVIEKAQVPAIAPVAISQTFASAPDNSFTYSLANPLDDFVEVYCGAAEELGFETLGVISDNTPTIEGVNELLLPGLKDCMNVVAEETAAVDAADVNAQVARLKDEDPDAILVSSVGGNFEVLVHNTLAQQLPETQRFSLASIGNQPEDWKLANSGALEGMVFMGSVDEDNGRTDAAQKAVRDLRGDDDYDITAYDAQAWDAVQLIKQAVEKAGATEGPAIAKAMESINEHDASFGQDNFTLSFGPKKHLGADGLCGLVLTEFGADNKPSGAWPDYQAPC